MPSTIKQVIASIMVLATLGGVALAAYAGPPESRLYAQAGAIRLA